MAEKKVYILWRGERGTFSQTPPGDRIAATISETALRNLAQDHHVFMLELSEDKESIEVTKL
jgi:hypothetical protein